MQMMLCFWCQKHVPGVQLKARFAHAKWIGYEILYSSFKKIYNARSTLIMTEVMSIKIIFGTAHMLGSFNFKKTILESF